MIRRTDSWDMRILIGPRKSTDLVLGGWSSELRDPREGVNSSGC